jgi:hypothetical protein
MRSTHLVPSPCHLFGCLQGRSNQQRPDHQRPQCKHPPHQHSYSHAPVSVLHSVPASQVPASSPVQTSSVTPTPEAQPSAVLQQPAGAGAQDTLASNANNANIVFISTPRSLIFWFSSVLMYSTFPRLMTMDAFLRLRRLGA